MSQNDHFLPHLIPITLSHVVPYLPNLSSWSIGTVLFSLKETPSSSIRLDPKAKELQYNPTVEQLYAPEVSITGLSCPTQLLYPCYTYIMCGVIEHGCSVDILSTSQYTPQLLSKIGTSNPEMRLLGVRNKLEVIAWCYECTGWTTESFQDKAAAGSKEHAVWVCGACPLR